MDIYITKYKRYVWIERSWISSVSESSEEFSTFWIWTNAMYSRIIAPCYTLYYIHSSGGWLCNKHWNEADFKHLLNALEIHYTISIDHPGIHYCGLQIYWNYTKNYVDISIPGYIVKAIHKFQHPAPEKPKYVPYVWIPPTYWQKIQYTQPPDTLPVLDKKDTKRIQSITGTF